MEEAKENLCNKCNSMKFGLPYYLLYLAKCSSYLVCVCVCVCVCVFVCVWMVYVMVLEVLCSCYCWKKLLAFLSVTNFLAIIFLSEIRKRLYIWYVHNILRKTNISYLLIGTSRYALQGVRNVSFLGNFADDL